MSDKILSIPEEDLSTSSAQVADTAVVMLFLQQVLTCSVPPLPGPAPAAVFIDNDVPCSLLVTPDLPVEFPQPVVLGGGGHAGGAGGGPGEAAGGRGDG